MADNKEEDVKETKDKTPKKARVAFKNSKKRIKGKGDIVLGMITGGADFNAEYNTKGVHREGGAPTKEPKKKPKKETEKKTNSK